MCLVSLVPHNFHLLSCSLGRHPFGFQLSLYLSPFLFSLLTEYLSYVADIAILLLKSAQLMDSVVRGILVGCRREMVRVVVTNAAFHRRMPHHDGRHVP